MTPSARVRPRPPGAALPPTAGESPDTLSARWRGQPHRLEVWYATVSDPANALGCWIHHELTAPVDGDPFAHGWTAIFRAAAAPAWERFGPTPVDAAAPPTPLASVAGAVLDPPVLRGEAGGLAWDIGWGDIDEEGLPAPPVWTFPAWAWEREALPGAQVVPVPSAPFRGTLRIGGDVLSLSPEATGNVAHIYGHGNPERWGWLHAELGGGDVLEVVSAVSRQPGLNRLPPLAFVQLRLGGRDWPRDPLVAAPLFRTRLGLPTWKVQGTVGRWRLRAEVTIPEAQAVRIGYVDPDGATATCTNSELADAEIVLEHRRTHWETERRWELRAGAHAEIGTRP